MQILKKYYRYHCSRMLKKIEWFGKNIKMVITVCVSSIDYEEVHV